MRSESPVENSFFSPYYRECVKNTRQHLFEQKNTFETRCRRETANDEMLLCPFRKEPRKYWSDESRNSKLFIVFKSFYFESFCEYQIFLKHERFLSFSWSLKLFRTLKLLETFVRIKIFINYKAFLDFVHFDLWAF